MPSNADISMAMDDARFLENVLGETNALVVMTPTMQERKRMDSRAIIVVV